MKRYIKFVLFVLYCVPYRFLCMYDDKFHRSMRFYLITVAVTVILGFLTRIFAGRKLIIPYTVCSGAISYVLSMVVLSEYNYYFKPLTAPSLSMLITAGMLLLQLPFIITKERQG